ncbi:MULTISPECIES: photosystem II cytochrome PsbV2 [unclassified Moorena]|uniref:photosystem II cytochrome PsbV2 n=1 Tax=unclassified Moorena TaxID=2683338 RepID=UPI0013C6C760|nr:MULTISPECIES: photosystem II cytochrome PsbV2 [unclassified Moorena]NEP31241.1 photosystem II cytochrome PsbV2 [Moorena sp. SIO3B2]NES44981.1 photosystem II cytochrome PsbV2 [Moorena sp. SIO2C4]
MLRRLLDFFEKLGIGNREQGIVDNNSRKQYQNTTLARGLFLSIRYLLLVVLVFCLETCTVSSPAQAPVNDYVRRYLDVAEPVPISLDGKGETKLFDGEDLSFGINLFSENCQRCHVGGSNIINPTVSLSLERLAGAKPPRDNLNRLVTFMRQPMTYDGTEESFSCRKVPESWLSQEKIEKLAAFVIRAAQKGPAWGTEDLF